MIKHCIPVGIWKYYYEDFKQYKYHQLRNTIDLSSFENWTDHTIQQHSHIYATDFYQPLFTKPKFLELLEHEKTIYTPQIEKNLQFVVDCESRFIQEFREKLKECLISQDCVDQHFIGSFLPMCGVTIESEYNNHSNRIQLYEIYTPQNYCAAIQNI